jgi:hypothetical protein
METLVTAPETCQRRVEDWPRCMVPGSAVNCVIPGAGGGGGGGTGAGAGAGGGGGGGTFFLQPEANIASEHAKQMIVIFLLPNMNIAS